MSDQLLVVRCQLGEREAFAELVRAWHPAVERYVGRMLGGPADDVVQEVWLAVVKGLPRLRQPDRFAPWLFTIARRAVMNRLRDAYARPKPEPIDNRPGEDGPSYGGAGPGSSGYDRTGNGGADYDRASYDRARYDRPGYGGADYHRAGYGGAGYDWPNKDGAGDDEAETVVNRETLGGALAALPAPEREVLLLFYLEDLPLTACAQICAVPVGTVKSRLHRARILLREELVRKGYEA
jgi:RNA polymerase sigma-70 factor (ECF subfamily)